MAAHCSGAMLLNISALVKLI